MTRLRLDSLGVRLAMALSVAMAGGCGAAEETGEGGEGPRGGSGGGGAVGGTGGYGLTGGTGGGGPAGPTVRKLAMNGTLGWDRSCVIMEDRTVRCWVMDHSPAPVSGLTDVEDVSIGEEHACALHVDGTVSCWGGNTFAELGLGVEDDSDHSPAKVPNLTGVTQVVAAGRFTLALLDDGTTVGWGENQSGELAIPATGFRVFEPTPVPISDVVQLAGGAQHACARHSDGTMSCWGRDKEGQLGRGTDSFYADPGLVPDLSDVIDIALGRDHSCAIVDGGALYCWGDNWGGKVGAFYGNTGPFVLPRLVGEVQSATDIDLGPHYSCALNTDGTATCFGNLLSGKPHGPHNLPTVMVDADGVAFQPVATVATSYGRACVLLEDMTSIYCWGYDACGVGPMEDELVPCLVEWPAW